MPKAYWISCYREISDPGKLAEYGRLAGPAITSGGGTFLAATSPLSPMRTDERSAR